jgi:hypothetical protein
MLPLEMVDRAHGYLNGDITLHDLENWVVHHLESLLAEKGSMTYLLVAAIELGLAEMGMGDIEEETFREQLQRFLSAHHRVFGGTTESLVASAGSNTPSEPVFVSIGPMPQGSSEYRTLVTASS